MNTTPALLFDNITYAYPPLRTGDEEHPVLRGIHFTVAQGERAVLLGRTGVGKTTLLLTTVGIVPQRTGGLFRGRAVVLGEDARFTPVPDLARRVGFLFQDPEVQLFHVRVDDEVAFALENLGLPEEEITRRVTWALEMVGLAEEAHRRPAHLSGGQKQRLALAAVLAMQPQILVLDEPTSSLDPAARQELREVLAHLLSGERTLFLATQEVDWAVEFGPTFHALAHGERLFSGPSTALFDQAQRLEAQGIPLPQVTRIAHKLRSLGIPTPPVFTEQEALTAWQSLLAARPRGPIPSFPPHPRAQAPKPLLHPPPIHVEDVHFTYEDGTHALRGVTWQVEPGEMVALVGANAAGKTTLAKHLNGLLRPTRGRVRVGDRDTRDTSVALLARDVGYVFQNPDHQIFASTVREEIAFAPRNLGMTEEVVKGRVEEMLHLFDLQEVADYPPAVLGAGQRRKVALASVLAAHPPVLILDEPTVGLDPLSARELMTRVKDLHRAGHTVILITHDMALVAEWVPRVTVMAQGQVLFDGEPNDLFARSHILQQARLLPPPLARLAHALAPLGFPPDAIQEDRFLQAFVTLFRAQQEALDGRV